MSGIAAGYGWADGRLLASLHIPDANVCPPFPNVRILFKERTP